MAIPRARFPLGMRRGVTTVEIVAIGDELLSGATVDSNAARIAGELEPLGLRVTHKATVRDTADAIADSVRTGLRRSGAVITTGGLGPTKDDVTKSAVASVLGRPLEFREDLWEALQRRWSRRGKIPETNKTQAEVPVGAEVLPNPRGTAPGLAVDCELGICIMLPGPPHEMQHILTESVAPFLAARADPEARKPFRRYLRTAGIAESAIAERVGKRNVFLEDVKWYDALRIGVFQALALFPGISRSGASITGGMIGDMKRPDAARFSFLMAVPVMIGAGVLAAFDLVEISNLASFAMPLLVGFTTSAVVGFLAIRWLLNYLTKNSLYVFSIYLVVISTLALILG